MMHVGHHRRLLSDTGFILVLSTVEWLLVRLYERAEALEGRRIAYLRRDDVAP